MKLAFGPALGAAALVLLTGCSTQRGDGTTVSKEVDISVQTEPAGARCTLQRGGQVIATLEATPQTATIERGIRAITVSCDKDGFISTIQLVESTFSPGDVKAPPRTDYSAAGGIGYGIGLMIIAAAIRSSPSNYVYPSTVTLNLEANSFSDEASRDAKFGALTTAVQDRAKKKIEEAQRTCGDNLDLCRTAKRDAERERDAELARLETFRQNAAIVPPAPPPAPAKDAKKTAAKSG
jgi:hypothetical protein